MNQNNNMPNNNGYQQMQVNTGNINNQNQVVNNQVPYQQMTQSINNKPKKKKKPLPIILILVIFILILYIFMDYRKDLYLKNQECSPVSTTLKEVQLDINSSLIQTLYNGVKTNIFEDVASINFDDQMKIYLAFKNIPNSAFYESNCNLFSNADMSPLSCSNDTSFTPKAIKEETVSIMIKRMYGEKTNIAHQNIYLGDNFCLGGYQYIPERKEYVEGTCKTQKTTPLKVTKKLTEARSQNKYIYLYEDVDYIIPKEETAYEHLVDGTYIHKFQLDQNYHYIYLGKSLEQKS